MKIKDKITQSLASITVELQEISPDFYVIGASAMILSGIGGRMKLLISIF